ncbi:Ammonia monooxygenase gamma subunit [Georgfuchsia toluolica]|uniref:Ammonia monooxygenase gamma subunit n=1 Tax=Georgfuchsia toluolica TaxID=424218 RepID=A0A916J3J8_9PROT|nr:cytochrome c1 [Georgfuchsia toluolica]CAG4883529.1 Ammonia monooxygenase gamma subunit [Georgfuchsia toluolica]
MKKLLIALLLAPLLALANPEAHLDKAPDRSGNQAALQNGARIFINYCLNCHSASFMRYNRLHDIGLNDEQISENLLFTGNKVGDLMRTALPRQDAKVMFGAAPPDLTLVARVRGSDWLYTYLRGFYRDDSRPSGWNNTVFANVGMPHVLWELQGEQELGNDHELKLVKPGKLSPEQYDAAVADLVGYLRYMGEPVAGYRKSLGPLVLLGFGVFFIFAYALKKEYWKDVH